MNTSALILLSTYHGEKYLAAQLDSIISQTFKDWTLLIRDDGSSSATLDIIKKYLSLDSRIILIEDDKGNLNIKNSFSVLMQHAVGRCEDFIFFCDQDDVWLPPKLMSKVNLLSSLEKKYSSHTPLLVHSDLRLVDKNLKEISPSFLENERLRRNNSFPLKTLLINNYVTGCAMGMNRALLNIVFPIPENVFMHDWWCALCAAANGKIEFVKEPTILYRQHDTNVIGSKSSFRKLKELVYFKKSFLKRRKNLDLCFEQAKNLLLRTDNKNANYALIKDFAELKEKNLFSRYILAKKIGLKPGSHLRAIAFWSLLLFAGS